MSSEVMQETIWDCLMSNMLRQIVINSILQEQALRSSIKAISNDDQTSLKEINAQRLKFLKDDKDIFNHINGKRSENKYNGTGSDASNGMTDTEYFTCLNCDRKIAGNRFASHVDRCLGGRTRK
ncbi:hypothetical protein LJB42_004201 [Komagataella kurtzmanii]|nr:hypothetical protein LJB42_004201 [Komagataella kurtzmanii]